MIKNLSISILLIVFADSNDKEPSYINFTNSNN